MKDVQKALFALNSKGSWKRQCLEEKRIRQSVPSAERNVKFPSNLTEADRYTAENVTLNEEIQGDIKLTS